ncbi:MAG: peptidase [Sphingobacteriales bacterium]|nr:peptidase [Sphingobacteriales bacterium]
MKVHKLIALTSFILLIYSCKKSTITPDPVPIIETPPPPAPNSTRTQLTLDSIYIYAKEAYLWNDALPSFNAFNPRGYNSFDAPILNLEDELFDITQFKINPSTTKPYEYSAEHPSSSKYSYLVEDNNGSSAVAQTYQKQASVTLDGDGDDFGIDLSSISSSDIRVKLVSPSSPAADAGVVRGDRILKVNGKTASAASQNALNDISNAFDGNNITLNIRRVNGTEYTKDLTRRSYTSSSVYKKSILTSGSKKVGYLSYARFSTLPKSRAELETIFADFASQGVTDLILDFRYNGGGYVETAEHMTNLIAPSAKSGSVMYVEFYNSWMQGLKNSADAKAKSVLSKQILYNSSGQPIQYEGRNANYADIDYSVAGNTYKFEKVGSLNNINNVIFIVSGNTASASELVINSLRPHMNVKLVGSKTYGKPVGFFPITIDKYSIYMSNFNIQNSAGQGNYYDGLPVDISGIDDVTHDFGDAQENLTAKALAYITNGTIVSSVKNNTSMSTSAVTTPSAEPIHIIKSPSFNGMIETRRKLN